MDVGEFEVFGAQPFHKTMNCNYYEALPCSCKHAAMTRTTTDVARKNFTILVRTVSLYYRFFSLSDLNYWLNVLVSNRSSTTNTRKILIGEPLFNLYTGLSTVALCDKSL